jgi:DNA topoisomerase-1
MGKPLIIVESPAKGELIKQFLGDGYAVHASRGHVRDLPEGASDVPAEARAQGFNDWAIHLDDFRPWYVIPDDKRDQVAKLRALMRDASELFLATDEDREGESISWHLCEVLKPRVPVKRMVFHEVTPEAIRAALAHPRAIDENRVAAQETRRIVDRIYGFAVSGLFWKKIRGARSAGRVQSPAVRMLVERERARMAFRSGTWWDVEARVDVANGSFSAQLQELGGKRVASGRDFDEHTGALSARNVVLLDEAAARGLAARLATSTGRVASLDTKPWRERPSPPFTTSTLQQEANRKLRWTAKDTMKAAQYLYEHGWITYMRTDSTALSDQAITAARALVQDQFGDAYLPKEPRRYASSAKNAQEAHEAIRPAGTRFRSLDEARGALAPDHARLYELIWKRAVACQMADAQGDQLQVVVAVDDATFVASGRTIRFAGFQRAYVEGSDDPEAELANRERLLPSMTIGEAARAQDLTAKEHHTQPPARYTEASLVKELEARGIGRPSTYADILETIVRRDYAFKRGNAFVPTHLAFLVTAFMERELSDLVSYDFTARLEDDLDEISVGKAARAEVLGRFYRGERGLEGRLAHAVAADASDIYRIPLAGAPDGDLHVRYGKFGAYVTDGTATANVPPDMAPDEVTAAWARTQLEKKASGPNRLGNDPVSGEPILLLDGRFGAYVQRGEATPPPKGKKGAAAAKPPRASLLPGMTPADVTLDIALRLLELPRTLGTHDGNEVKVANGRYGPYLQCGTETRSVPPTISLLDMTLDDARELLAQPATRGRRNGPRAAPAALRSLGADPVSGGEIRVLSGRFGPYVTDGTTNATLPRTTTPEGLSAEDAQALLARKREAGPPARKGRGRAAGRTAKSSSGAAAKKPAARRPKA